MIKFRAWDKESRIIRNVANVNFDTKIITCDWKRNEVESCTEMYDKHLFEGEYELLQSTGLKDRNGVEIYENDIVNIHEFINVGGIESYVEDEKETIGIVKYGCIYDSPMPEWYLETKGDCNSFSFMDLHDESFEVLGNQFEHPHLLEE